MHPLEHKLIKHIRTIDSITTTMKERGVGDVHLMMDSLHAILVVVGDCYGKINEVLYKEK